MGRQSYGAFLTLFAAAATIALGCGRKPDTAEVVITLRDSAAPLSSATVLVDYSQASATLARSGAELACAAIVPNMTAHFSDDGQGRMTIQATAPQGISAPVDLAVCRMIPEAPGVDAAAISSRLRVSLVAGADRAGVALDEQKLASAGSGRGKANSASAPERPARERGTAGGVAGERRARLHDAPEPADHAADAAGERLAVAPNAGSGAAVPGGGSPSSPAAQPKTLMPRNDSNRATPAAPADRGGDKPSGDDDSGSTADDAGAADANDDSDTDRSAQSYTVTVGVNNSAGSLGALQFDISYRGRGSGGFAGAAGSARCRTEVAAALATFNDKGNGTLSGALIDLDGIPTPGAVASCTFKSRGNISAGDFSVRVVDAADIEGNTPPRAPEMGVQNLRAE